jgi:hypothetical protein
VSDRNRESLRQRDKQRKGMNKKIKTNIKTTHTGRYKESDSKIEEVKNLTEAFHRDEKVELRRFQEKLRDRERERERERKSKFEETVCR